MLETIRFTPPSTGEIAWHAEILPEQGGHCVSFRGVEDSVSFSVFEPVSLAHLMAAPTRYGCPFLFPYANRIAGETMAWEGHTYRVDPPRHGLLRHCAWRTVVVAESSITCETEVTPRGDDTFPFHFRARVTYTLDGRGLTIRLHVENLGRSFPYSCGFHPYLAVNEDRPVTIALPFRKYAELNADVIPTGIFHVVAGRYDFLPPGRPLVRDQMYDDLFTDTRDLQGDDVSCRVRWQNLPPRNDHFETTVEFSPYEFPYLCLYTPPNRKTVCIEPYTALTDAVHHLDDATWGLRILKEGGEATFTIRISCRVLHEI